MLPVLSFFWLQGPSALHADANCEIVVVVSLVLLLPVPGPCISLLAAMVTQTQHLLVLRAPTCSMPQDMWLCSLCRQAARGKLSFYGSTGIVRGQRGLISADPAPASQLGQ